jgi:hypothetical protein
MLELVGECTQFRTVRIRDEDDVCEPDLAAHDRKGSPVGEEQPFGLV